MNYDKILDNIVLFIIIGFLLLTAIIFFYLYFTIDHNKIISFNYDDIKYICFLRSYL